MMQSKDWQENVGLTKAICARGSPPRAPKVKYTKAWRHEQHPDTNDKKEYSK